MKKTTSSAYKRIKLDFEINYDCGIMPLPKKVAHYIVTNGVAAPKVQDVVVSLLSPAGFSRARVSMGTAGQ